MLDFERCHDLIKTSHYDSRGKTYASTFADALDSRHYFSFDQNDHSGDNDNNYEYKFVVI